MKTPEDEAFDDLARKQGNWGGGYQAKRQMAADKFIAAEERKVGERYGYVPKLHPSEWMNAQPAQESVQHWSDCAVHNGPAYPAGPCDCGATEPWNEDEWRRNNWRCGHGWLRGEQCEICNAPQPAQEPVAWTLLLTGEHHGIIGEAGEKFIGAPECYQRVNVYTTPPKREWVGLTDEEIDDAAHYCVKSGQSVNAAIRAIEAKLKEKNNGT